MVTSDFMRVTKVVLTTSPLHPAGYYIKNSNNFKKNSKRAVDDGNRELPLFALPIDPCAQC